MSTPETKEDTDLIEVRKATRAKYALLHHKMTEELIALGKEILNLPGINGDTPAAKSLQGFCVSALQDAKTSQERFATLESQKIFLATY